MPMAACGSPLALSKTRQIASYRPGRAVSLSQPPPAGVTAPNPPAELNGGGLKESSAEEIGRAIRAVTGGDVLLDAAVAGRVIGSLPERAGQGQAGQAAAPFPELTPREREILDLMARGLSNPAIAERMFLSEKTVRNYVSTIFAKIHAGSRAAAIAAARDAGLGLPPAGRHS